MRKVVNYLSTLINEERFIEGNISKYEERLNSPIRRFTDKTFTPVKYWHINGNTSTVDKGYGDIADILGKDSPLKYQIIQNLPLYGLEAILLQIGNEEQGLDTSYESEAIIMANTLVPLQNDFFMIRHLKEGFIFRVTSVEYDTIVSAGCYKIAFQLEYIDPGMEDQLNSQTDGDFTCILENIGTQERSIITTTEFNKVQEIDKVYDEICNIYMTFYYNKRYNCFLGDFLNGRKLYDPLQTVFIMKHGIFRKKNQIDSLYMTEQFSDPRRKIKYHNSIYHFMETRRLENLSRFDYVTFPGVNNHQTAFYRWLDKYVDVLDIQKPLDPMGTNVYHILSEEYVNCVKLNDIAPTRVGDLIQRYIRKEELTIDDIKLDITEDLLDVGDANLELFFLIPILLYVIKQVVSTGLRKEFIP